MTNAPESKSTVTEDPDLMLLAGYLDSNLNPEQIKHLKPVMVRIMEKSLRRTRILTLVQEALQQLRLDMKYLVFDLEATRRERDELKERFNVD